MAASDPSSDFARYSRGAIFLHWLMALLIVWVGILGLLHDSWPKHSQAFWINIHALCGLLIWVLLLARIVWRRKNPPPPLPAQLDAFSRRLSAPVHWLFYVLLFIIPLIGIVTFIWHGRAFDFGLFQIDFGVKSNRAIFHPTEDIHGYLAYALFALIGLHVFAALWHHYIRRNRLIARMWPGP
jgi:cytochrome b561